MKQEFSIQEVARAVNEWCAAHRVEPASGQAGEAVTERNIRYYRTIGLLDAPANGSGHGFGEKHRLQLIALRILQAQGLPLRRIRELLFGRSLAELREIQRRGMRESQSRQVTFARASDELWRTIPLDNDFLLVSRKATAISDAQKAAIISVLNPASPHHRPLRLYQQKGKKK